MAQWIGIGLDGVLAQWQEGQDPDQIGLPIQTMVDRVEQWMQQGYEVRVVTERAINALDAAQVEAWLDYHDLPELTVTHSIDGEMIALWHDRAIHVELNQGDIGAPSELLAYIESDQDSANAEQHGELKDTDNFDALDNTQHPVNVEPKAPPATLLFDQDDTGEGLPAETVFIESQGADLSQAAKKPKTKQLSQEQLEAILNDDEFDDERQEKRLSDTSLDNLFETLDSPQFFKGA